MERGSAADHTDVRLGQRIAVRELDQMGEHQLGQCVDMDHMESALTVPELYDMAQDIDHHRALLFIFIDLLGYQGSQLFLFGVQQHRVHETAVDDGHVKGTIDEIRDTQRIGPFHLGGSALGGDHDDRDILDPALLVHDLQDTKTVHIWHHDIQQDCGDLVFMLLEDRYGLHTVLCFQDDVFILQHIRQDGAVHLRIIRDQDRLLVLLFFAHKIVTLTNKKITYDMSPV